MTLQDTSPADVGHDDPTLDRSADPHECTDCSGLTRRTVLRGAGFVSLGAAATLLAACSGSTSPSASAKPAPAAPATGGATAGGPAGGAVQLAKLADIPVGGALGVTGPDGKPMILSQPVAGTIVGMSAICTHQGCTVAADGAHLRCPCHGSVFQSADGKVVSGPARDPLPSIAVHVDGTGVVAG